MDKFILLKEFLGQIDISTEIITRYDAVSHNYANEMLYQAEAYIISSIGQCPGITISSLAEQKKCSKSACSQVLKKLIQKEYVYKARNEKQYREFNLFLTELGQEIFASHTKLNEDVCQRYFEKIDDKFSQEEIYKAISLLKILNEEFEKDLETTVN